MKTLFLSLTLLTSLPSFASLTIDSAINLINGHYIAVEDSKYCQDILIDLTLKKNGLTINHVGNPSQFVDYKFSTDLETKINYGTINSKKTAFIKLSSSNSRLFPGEDYYGALFDSRKYSITYTINENSKNLIVKSKSSFWSVFYGGDTGSRLFDKFQNSYTCKYIKQIL
jgi:hypothetical protein